MFTWQFLSQSETVILRRQYAFILTSQRNGKIPQDRDKVVCFRLSSSESERET